MRSKLLVTRLSKGPGTFLSRRHWCPCRPKEIRHRHPWLITMWPKVVCTAAPGSLRNPVSTWTPRTNTHRDPLSKVRSKSCLSDSKNITGRTVPTLRRAQLSCLEKTFTLRLGPHVGSISRDNSMERVTAARSLVKTSTSRWGLTREMRAICTLRGLVGSRKGLKKLKIWRIWIRSNRIR